MREWRAGRPYAVVIALCAIVAGGCSPVTGLDDLHYGPGMSGAPCSLTSDCATGVCEAGACRWVTCEPGSTKACYTGPEGTEGVGLCKSGVALCGDDDAWGPCVDDILPGGEACETPADEDCDGNTPPCAAVWSKAMSYTPYQMTTGLAVDGDGNIALGGAFWDSLFDLGNGVSLSKGSGGQDGWVAKLDPYGKPVWAKRYGAVAGASTDQAVTKVAFDHEGNLLVAGWSKGAVDFGDGPVGDQNPDGYHSFVVKLDAEGNHVWSWISDRVSSWSPNASMGMNSMGIAPDGSIILSEWNIDSRIIKLSPSGSPLWDKQIVSTSVAVDEMGNVFLAVSTPNNYAPDLGGGSLSDPNQPYYKRIVAIGKLDPDGVHIWSKGFVSSMGSYPEIDQMSVSSSGEIVLSGRADNHINYGCGLVKAVGSFVVKFNSYGDCVFSHGYYLGNPSKASFALTPLGDVFVTGYFTGTASFGGDPFTSITPMASSIFVVRLDAKGSHVWSRKFDSGFSTAAVFSPTGNLLLAGGYKLTPDFGAGPLPNDSSQANTSFLASLHP